MSTQSLFPANTFTNVFNYSRALWDIFFYKDPTAVNLRIFDGNMTLCHHFRGCTFFHDLNI